MIARLIAWSARNLLLVFFGTASPPPPASMRWRICRSTPFRTSRIRR